MVTWGYLPEEERIKIEEHLQSLGAEATSDAPVGWVSFELDSKVQPVLRLRLWPQNINLVLAEADPHCWKISWKL